MGRCFDKVKKSEYESLKITKTWLFYRKKYISSSNHSFISLKSSLRSALVGQLSFSSLLNRVLTTLFLSNDHLLIVSMNSIAVLCFLTTIFTVNVLCQTSNQEPLKANSVRQVVTHQAVSEPKSTPQQVPFQSQKPPVSQVVTVRVNQNRQTNRPNVPQSVRPGPFLVPKIRANIPRSRSAVPIMPSQDESPYIRLVNYDKKHFPQ